MFPYSLIIVYQAVLPSIHISLTGVNIPHLDYSIPMVLFWLLPFSFLRKSLPYLVFQEDVGNLFSFGPCKLESLSAPQKCSILYQNLILKLLQVLQLFSFFLLLHKPPLLSFLSCLSLDYLSYLLSSLLNIAGLYHLFQVGLELLLLFMPFLHLGIVL